MLLSDIIGGSAEDARKQADEEKKRRRLIAMIAGATEDDERTESAHRNEMSEFASRGVYGQVYITLF